MTSAEEAAAPRLLVPILVVGLLVGVCVVLAWPPRGSGGERAPAAAVGGPATASRLEAQAADLLRAWDRRRAAAWAAGDAASLRALYVPGASAADADVAMLGSWSSRGLAVDGLTTQLLSVRVLRHGPSRWVLRVRDRVTGAVAAGAGLSESLPPGATVERRLVLRRVAGSWRVASVRPAAARS